MGQLLWVVAGSDGRVRWLPSFGFHQRTDGVFALDRIRDRLLPRDDGGSRWRPGAGRILSSNRWTIERDLGCVIRIGREGRVAL